MKKIVYYSIATVALFLISLHSGFSQNKLQVKVNSIEVNSDTSSVDIDFDIIFRGYQLSPDQQLVLTPVIENSVGMSKSLPSVIVNGKRRDNLHKRMLKLGKSTDDSDAYQVVRSESRNLTSTIGYSTTTIYEKWMDNSNLYLSTDLCGCGGATNTPVNILATEQLVKQSVQQPVYTYTPHIQLIVPPEEKVKSREEVGTAYITFQSGKSLILPELFDNAKELQLITNSLSHIKSQPTAQITAITIQAYASPDGTYQGNLTLSQRRADALWSYIEQKHEIPLAEIRAIGMGENWDGLITLVEEDHNLADKGKILQIIRTISSLPERKAQLKSLAGGQPYRYMLNNLFPRLRRSDYRIEYTIPKFSVEEGNKFLHARPYLLSHEEFYLIADTYEKGSEAFNEVFRIALQVYPDDTIANLNVAAMYLLQGNNQEAKRILQHFDNEPLAWNNIGVILMEERKLDEAEEYLIKAKNSGAVEANDNLQILSKLRLKK